MSAAPCTPSPSCPGALSLQEVWLAAGGNPNAIDTLDRDLVLAAVRATAASEAELYRAANEEGQWVETRLGWAVVDRIVGSGAEAEVMRARGFEAKAVFTKTWRATAELAATKVGGETRLPTGRVLTPIDVIRSCRLAMHLACTADAKVEFADMVAELDAYLSGVPSIEPDEWAGGQ